MNPFNTRKAAAEYILMSDGYDGRAIVEALWRHLNPGSAVLEVGMGPGRDIPLLEEKYRVTGSDISTVFLDMYREKHPDADLLHLDLVTLETDRRFDCIYSNKVLHHLSPEQLRRSLVRQGEVLNPRGLLCHTLWYGDKMITVRGMDIHYYTEKTIADLLDGTSFEVVSATTYREMDHDDSLLLFIRKKHSHC